MGSYKGPTRVCPIQKLFYTHFKQQDKKNAPTTTRLIHIQNTHIIEENNTNPHGVSLYKTFRLFFNQAFNTVANIVYSPFYIQPTVFPVDNQLWD